MWYLTENSSSWSTWGREQSQENFKTGRVAIRSCYIVKIHSFKESHINESSIIPLPIEAWQEEPHDPDYQDLTPGIVTQAAPSDMTEYTESSQVT